MASEGLENRRIREQLSAATAEQDAAQTTTNDYVIVAESLLDVRGKNTVCYVLKNSGANTITGQLRGRVKDEAGNPSAWVAITSPAAADAAAGASTAFTMTSVPWSEVAMFVESKVDGSHGAAEVFGIAKAL